MKIGSIISLEFVHVLKSIQYKETIYCIVEDIQKSEEIITELKVKQIIEVDQFIKGETEYRTINRTFNRAQVRTARIGYLSIL